MRNGHRQRLCTVIALVVLGLCLAPAAWAADTTPPSAPTQPTEGSSTTDKDYDSNGSYTVYWKAASDTESGISAYEVQEQVGTSGTWTTLTATTTKLSYAVSGRLHNTRYVYQVRAKNGAGLWGAWSPASDGMLVDTTAPTPASVTDDGATTASTTTLHATWTPAVDPESGLEKYQYIIRRDAVTGSTMVGYTSVELATEVTRANLSLTEGVTYFIGVRAKNNAGLYSSTSYSDGIQVVTADVTPPTGTISINAGAAVTNATTVTLTLAATDDRGVVTSMRFSNDNSTYSDPEPYATTKSWTLSAGDGLKTIYAQFQDAAGNWNAASPATDTITLDTTPPAAPTVDPVTSPTNQTSQAISGTKEAETGLWLSGSEVVPVNTATTWSYTASLSEGDNTFTFTAKDEAGNESAGATATMTLDTILPSAPTVDPVTTPTNQTTHTLTGTKEADTGIWFGERAVVPRDSATTWSSTATLSEGENVFTVTAHDAAGNASAATSVTITLDTIPPAAPTLDPVISPTNQATQTLTGTKEANTGMWLAGQAVAAFDGATTWSYLATLVEGANTLTFTAHDAVGLVSAETTITIHVDTTGPVFSAIAATTTPLTATLTWTTDEPATSQVESGVTPDYGQLTALDPAMVLSHSVTLTGLTPATTYHVRLHAQDALANATVSADQMVTTAADTTPPTGTITLNGGAAYTTSATVTLALSATDVEGPVGAIQVANDVDMAANYAAPQPYTTSTLWDLSAGDGAKTVFVKFQDQAGNWSVAVSDTIILDTTPPLLQMTDPQDQQVITGP